MTHSPMLPETLPLLRCDPFDDLDGIADYPSPPRHPLPPDAVAVVRGIARSLVEVLVGTRSPLQLTRWLTPIGSRELSAWLARHRFRHARLARCRMLVPTPGRLEAVLTFQCGAHLVAVALRLDARDGSWTCHDLEVVLHGTSGSARQRWDCDRDRP